MFVIAQLFYGWAIIVEKRYAIFGKEKVAITNKVMIIYF